MAEFMEFNLGGTIGVGDRCLTGSVHYTSNAVTHWHPAAHSSAVSCPARWGLVPTPVLASGSS